MTKEEIHSVVVEALSLLQQNQVSAEPDTILYGMGSALDSFDLVTLVVQIEQKLYDRLGIALTLASEKALSMRESPFRSVGALESYIQQLLCEDRCPSK